MTRSYLILVLNFERLTLNDFSELINNFMVAKHKQNETNVFVHFILYTFIFPE